MKTYTKVIIAILVALIGLLLMINHLFDKKEQISIVEQKLKVNQGNIITTNINTTKTTKTTKKVVKTTKKIITKNTPKHQETQNGYRLTHYGYDCKKCSGITASGYNISKTQYYNDSTYGNVRVVAMCSKYPLYSIIKIKDYKMGGDITAIVLDRGVGCSTIDLAVKNEKQAAQFGIQKNVQIELLRTGK
jgi:3D (Asp-Asp-Asp) domain-containing protein